MVVWNKIGAFGTFVGGETFLSSDMKMVVKFHALKLVHFRDAGLESRCFKVWRGLSIARFKACG
jgi:hypothetical protein